MNAQTIDNMLSEQGTNRHAVHVVLCGEGFHSGIYGFANLKQVEDLQTNLHAYPFYGDHYQFITHLKVSYTEGMWLTWSVDKLG